MSNSIIRAWDVFDRVLERKKVKIDEMQIALGQCQEKGQ